MRKSRAQFKYILRQCKLKDNKLAADKVATKLLNKGDKCFWKEIKKLNSSNAVKAASTVNNVTGVRSITDMWKGKFHKLLNSSQDVSKKNYVLQHTNAVDNESFDRFTGCDVSEAIMLLKNGKAAGLDNLYGEHFKYAHEKLYILLNLVFNSMLIHAYLPASLMDTIIIPLVKDKRGDLTDADNYRPLAITCVASKVLEFLILNRCRHMLTSNDNQFGFKNKHSTDMCIFSLKLIIEYYMSMSSPVFICFLDASKAFDKVNHWVLFSKLLDRKVPLIIIRLLIYWYGNQCFMVQWDGSISMPFNVSNGVRQGGILSPYLFNVYTNDLSDMLNSAGVGCFINDMWINHLFYADDSVILAPTPNALQALLDICDNFANEFEITYNTKKTFCMYVKPKWFKGIYVEHFLLSKQPLSLLTCINILVYC